jgi:hypothetical protein
LTPRVSAALCVLLPYLQRTIHPISNPNYSLMKKLLLLALAGLAFTTASAQTEKGATYWGASLGNLRYSRSSQKNSITADLGYSNSKSNAYYDSSIRSIRYGAVPFARYYIAGADKHQFFGQLNAGLVWFNRKDKGSFGSGSSTTNYGIVGLALGYNYFLTPGAALEATAGYNRNGVNGNSNGTFDIRAGLAIFLPSRQAATAPSE